MSRKDREEDLVEELEKENRQLKATIRSLQKRLKKLDRGHIKSRERNVSREEFEEEKNTCLHCQKGNIVESVVANRKLKRCDTCDWRAKAVKLT